MRCLKHKLLFGGPATRFFSLSYAQGIRLLNVYAKMSFVLKYLIPSEIQLLREVHREVSPDLPLSEFVTQSLMSNLWVPWKEQMLMQNGLLNQYLQCEGDHLLQAALAEGNGVILTCTHTPLMKYIAYLPYLKGCEVTYLGHLKPHHLASLGDEKLAAAASRAEGSDTAYLALRTAQLYKAKACLKKGGVVILFADDTEGRGGMNLPFFQRIRPFRPGLAALALGCNAAILPLSSSYLPNGMLSFKVKEALLFNEMTETSLTEAYAAALREEWAKNLQSFEWRALRKYLSFAKSR